MFKLGALVAASLLAIGAAAHAAECDNPDALGVSRTLEVDPAQLPKIGTMSYHDSLPLDDHEIVITFDDGPLPPHTEKILEIMAAQCVKATYFMIGKMAAAYPESVRKVAAAGHTIGTHSWSHPWFTRMSMDKARDEIDRGFSSVQAALGDEHKVAPFFRFPGLLHRADSEAYLAERGIMVWSVDFHGDDWHHRISPQEIVKRVMTRLAANHNRGVLLLHDIHARTAAALPSLLTQLKEQGYKVVHVVPATEIKPAPNSETPVASASPDGTGLPAAATNPAAARRAVSAAVAAVATDRTDAEVGAGDAAKAAPVLADHPSSASAMRKRLVLRNNHAAFARRLAVARNRQGTQARFAAAHVTPARAAAVTRLTQAHAAVTPRRVVLIHRAGASARPTQACANCRVVPGKRVHPGSPRA
ncbi:MAG: polysaccharide deacetylase family protein [Xanthobacteraceae bacterium]|nr:polysaccharide deacetylase family protein [Xanthobacteraceae bacterium]MBV9627894.1 polysaccharide deacetylase family protein [Xanthobacteraceae bacterium]